MRWIIKCPAPGGYSQRNWGDLHFARSLCRQLEQRGSQVVIQNKPDWCNGDDDADVVLLVRGKFAYVPRNRDAINVMWLLSHPDDVDADEFGSFDVNCIASISFANRLEAKFGRDKIVPLLQCTDTLEHTETVLFAASDRRNVIFVGGSRNVERWCILNHVRAGLPLKVWGTGWEQWPEIQDRVVGKHVDNQRLGQLYGSARATLNDHWPDMARYGFINNRIFDALACGLPVVSDYLLELSETFREGIHYYYCDEPLAPAFAQFERDYPRYYDGAQSLAGMIRRKHTFSSRADELLSVVENCRRRRFAGGPSSAFRWLGHP
jgi:hypothetical protein